MIILSRSSEIQVFSAFTSQSCQLHQLSFRNNTFIIIMSDKQNIVEILAFLEVIDGIKPVQGNFQIMFAFIQLSLKPIEAIVEFVDGQHIRNCDCRVLRVLSQMMHDMRRDSRDGPNNEQAHCKLYLISFKFLAFQYKCQFIQHTHRMLNSNNNIDKNGNKNLNSIGDELQKVPFMVRIIFISLILVCLADWIFGGWPSRHLPLNGEAMLSWKVYEWLRILTAWSYEPSLLTLIIMLQNCYSFLIKYQYRNSSAVLLNDLFVNLLGMTVVAFAVQTLLSLYVPVLSDWTYSVVGIWINMVYKYCYYNSNVMIKICLTDYKIPLKYYPFCIFALVNFIHFGIRIDSVLGLGFAVVECRFLNGGMMLFTKDTYQDKEKFAQWLGIAKFQSWLNLDPNNIELNHRMTVSSSQFYIDLYNYQPNIKLPSEQTHPQSSAGFAAFKGNPVTIGEADLF